MYVPLSKRLSSVRPKPDLKTARQIMSGIEDVASFLHETGHCLF